MRSAKTWTIPLATAACLGLITLSGCTQPEPISTLEGLYGVRPPNSVKVIHYRADVGFIDPSFVWELAPIDEGFLQAMIQSKGLQPPAAGTPVPPSGYTWHLGWWNQKALDQLTEGYFSDQSGGLRVWVDRPNNRLFVEFAGR